MLSGGQSECFKQNNVQNTYINCHDYERFSLQWKFVVDFVVHWRTDI